MSTVKVLALLAMGMFLFSCNNSENANEADLEDVQNSMEETAETTADYADGVARDLTDKAEQMGKEANERWAATQRKFDELSDDMKSEYQQQIDNIKQQADKLDAKMEELKTTSMEKRNEVAEEVQTLKKALDESIDTFEEELQK